MYLLLKLVVYVSKMPRWVEHTPSVICVNRKLWGIYLLVFRWINFQFYNFFKHERWMESCALEKWESTLNLCVHAHGNDVDLIMGASCNNNNPLVVISTCIYVWSFATVFSTILFFFDPISWTSWSTCLLQFIAPVQPLLWSTFEYYSLVSQEYHGTT